MSERVRRVQELRRSNASVPFVTKELTDDELISEQLLDMEEES